MQSEPRSPGLLQQCQYEGYWWVPRDPNDQRPGVLTYDPRDGLHLELLGHFTPLEQFAEQGGTQTIHGSTKSGKRVTLYDCWSFNPELRMPGIITESFYAPGAMVGNAHIADVDTATFQSCAFRFSALEEWLSAQPFSVTSRSIRPPHALDVAFCAPAENEYVLEEIGARLKTACSFQTEGDIPRHHTIRFQSWLVLEPAEAQTLTWYVDAITKFRNLIALCYGAPIYIEGVELIDPLPSDEQDQQRLDLLYPQNPSPPSGKVSLPAVKMSFSSLSDPPTDALNNWLKVCDTAKPALPPFFGVLYSRGMYTDLKFLLLAQAIEAFHRCVYPSTYICQSKYKCICKLIESAIPAAIPDELRTKLLGILRGGNEYSFRSRLADLNSGPLNQIGTIRIDNKTQRKIVHTRNYYTHRDGAPGKNVASTDELHDLIMLIRGAMSAILFEMIGIERCRIRDWMEQKGEFRRLLS